MLLLILFTIISSFVSSTLKNKRQIFHHYIIKEQKNTNKIPPCYCTGVGDKTSLVSRSLSPKNMAVQANRLTARSVGDRHHSPSWFFSDTQSQSCGLIGTRWNYPMNGSLGGHLPKALSTDSVRTLVNAPQRSQVVIAHDRNAKPY